MIKRKEPSSCWKGTSLKKQRKCEDNIKVISGLDPSHIQSFPVYFQLNQEYGSDVDHQEKEEGKSELEMGLIAPMTMNSKPRDPYTNKVIPKRTGKTSVKCGCCCCLIPCCCCRRKVKYRTKEFIMTYEFGDKTKPLIVLIHGMGGSSMLFFKLFKRLSEHYHVISLDLLGMGSSSRPEFLARTKDEADDFFCQSLEKWREAMNIDKLNLVCHSFGGYVSSRYALRYPHRVEKLLFLSPHGCEPKPENFDNMLMNGRRGCQVRCFLKCTMCFFKIQCKPLLCFRFFGRCFGPCMIKRYVRRHMNGLNEEERDVFHKYIYQIIMNPTSGEEAVFKMFQMPILAHTPIFNEIDQLEQHGIEVAFAYGDLDWVDTAMSGVRVSQQLKKAGHKVYMIENAKHQLYMDNPNGLIDAIDDFILC